VTPEVETPDRGAVAPFADAHDTPPFAAISLTVNGQRRRYDGDPTMPLLWFLRDELSLTGTKYGCGISQCGACTVHVNGAPARACQRRMETLNGATVTTIEGLHPTGEHPLQVAWRDLDVPQCGFCQSGQIMQAAGLLARTTKPGDTDIDAAMNGHICRCGTYPRIRAAIKAAAEKLP
jgi:isoquinoline 1-oxidoreductase alpha subunit